MMHRLGFRVSNGGGMVSLVPDVDGKSLVEIVAEYESAEHYSPARAYGGIVPESFDFGDLSRYYLGNAIQQWPEKGQCWLLACDCGEAGCWPLEARVNLTDAVVAWSDFRQPHRPSWDYSGLGPFQFGRAHYEAAVTEAVRSFAEATAP